MRRVAAQNMGTFSAALSLKDLQSDILPPFVRLSGDEQVCPIPISFQNFAGFCTNSGDQYMHLTCRIVTARDSGTTQKRICMNNFSSSAIYYL